MREASCPRGSWALEQDREHQCPPDQQQQGPTETPPGASVMDTSGSGGANIGIGQAPIPGEQGFSGSGQAANTQPPQANGGEQPPMGGIQ